MTNLFDSFAVSIKEENNNINGTLVNYNNVKIVHLKHLICLETNINIGNYNGLNLWKVASGVNLEDIITEEQIEDKGEKLVPINYVSKYFPGQAEADDSLIIVQVPTGKCLPMVYLSNKKFALSHVL